MDASKVEEPDRTVPIEELKVLERGEVPPYVRNGVIHESFVAERPAPTVPTSAGAWEGLRSNWMAELRGKVFAGWPSEPEAVPTDRAVVTEITHQQVASLALDFTAQDSRCRACDYGYSTFNVPHRFVASTLYTLPFGKGQPMLNRGGVVNQLAGGWQLSVIATAQSG